MSRYFDVPFADRARAKELGARWASDVEMWFAPDSDPGVAQALGQHWREVKPALPIHVFPGEQTQFGGNDLGLELVPSTCWLSNLGSTLAPEDFKRVRMGVCQRSGKACEICSGVGKPEEKIYLDVHPRFEYVDGKQVLRRLLCVCSTCLHVIDFGIWQWKGRTHREEALEHLRRVNSWTASQATEHIYAAFELWAQRSRQEWEADLSILTEAGLQVRIPSPQSRAKATINLDEIRPKDMDISTFLAKLSTLGHGKA